MRGGGAPARRRPAVKRCEAELGPGTAVHSVATAAAHVGSIVASLNLSGAAFISATREPRRRLLLLDAFCLSQHSG